MDVFTQKPFYVLLSIFSLCRVHFLRSTVIAHALEALDQIPTAETPKPYSLQCKDGGETSIIFSSSEKDDSQQSDVEPEH